MHIEKKTLRNIFLGVIACIVIYWMLNATESVNKFFSVIYGVISPFLVGAGIAFFINVPMTAIEKHMGSIKRAGLRRVLALVLTVLLVLLIFTLVFCLLIPQVTETIQELIPKMTSFFLTLEKKVLDFFSSNPQLKEWFINNTGLESFNWAGIAEKALSIVGSSLSAIVTSTFAAIGSITGALMNAMISVVFAVYCLCHKETLGRQGRKLMYAFLPEHIVDKVIRIAKLTSSTFSNFFTGQCIEVCILGGMFAISMAIFRMPYIPLVSVLIAVTAFIPVVGAWVGCVCGAFLILVASPMQAVGFVILFVVLQQIENNVVYPRVVGTSIGLSGMWVLVAVAVGGELFGVGGMILMIPLAAVIYTLLSELTNKVLATKNIPPDKLEPTPDDEVKPEKKDNESSLSNFFKSFKPANVFKKKEKTESKKKDEIE